MRPGSPTHPMVARLTRRALLGRLAGLTAGAAFLPLLSACASGSTQPAAPKTESKPAESKPAETKPAAPAAPAQPTAAPKAEAKPTDAPKPAAQAPAAKGTTKIVFARTRDASGTTEKLVQTFNASGTGVEAELRVMPDTSADYRNALVPQLQAKSGEIDVFVTDVIWTAEFAAAGWVDDLSSRFGGQMKNDFLPGPVESTVYDGKNFMVPYWTDAGIFYYRSDLLKELNAEPPKTWDDLLKVGNGIRDKHPDVAPYVWQGAVHEGLALNVLEYIWSNGGDALNEKGDVVLNSPNAVEALQFLVDLIHVHKISPEGVTSSRTVENNQIWFEGRAGLMRSWSFVYGILSSTPSKYSLRLDQLGYTNIPAGPKGTVPGASCLGGWNCAINASSKNQDAAWTFIEWVTGFEGQKATAIGTANPMTRKAIYEDKQVLEKVPITKVAQASAAVGRNRPVTPFYQDVSTSLQRNFHAALTKQATPADAIARAADELASIQKRSG